MSTEETIEHRITPRPVREEQARQEVGQTEFARGVPAFLLVLFLTILLSVPAMQYFVSDGTYAAFSGDPYVALLPSEGPRVEATVRAVSAPPDRGGVYSDFLMQLHVDEISGADIDDEELLLIMTAMKGRMVYPAAAVKRGARIRFMLRDWSDVEQKLSGINSSVLEDDRFLTMPRAYGMNVEIEGVGEIRSGREFLHVWSGYGKELPLDARIGIGAGIRKAWRESIGASPLDRFLKANAHLGRRIKLYESGLDDTAVIAHGFRAPVQALLAAVGVGNEKAYVGKDGWLFYQPDVASITGLSFLDPVQLRRRVRSVDAFSEPIQPDPRIAILDFHRALAQRGIELVIMPTPVKASVHPEKLGRLHRFVRNPSLAWFIAHLKTAGIHVFDPAPVLIDLKAEGEQWLASDTHWGPNAAMTVAKELADVLRSSLDETPDPGWIATSENVTQIGDIARMLDLPHHVQKRFEEGVTIRTVRDRNGNDWRPDRRADVLLLGDSFSNVYSLEAMGWGASAGLAEHLAYNLGRPIDRLARNDDGAYASRQMLVDALKRDPGRLDGKKFVIWQFAERELTFGDWKLLDLPKAKAPSKSEATATTQFRELAASDSTAVQGKDGWLFLASELRLLGHGPFWGEHAESEEADPLHSITDLNSKLEELGIQLIFCPAPPRAVIYPDKILDDAAPGLRVDEDLQAFYAALREKGVTVVDVTETLIEARGEDDALGPVSCEQDSHWSPRGLRIVAEAVVQEFADDDWLADATKGSFTEQQPEPLLYVGDLVRQLEGHPATQSRTTISRMTDDPAGQTPLTFDDASPVLLLADSHGLVFSTGDDMHCTAAGFGEALSAEVGFAIDRMARRGSGDQVRRDLARRFIRKPEEAAQKKVLIYTFAARTLLTGTNWKPVPLKR